MKTIMMLILVSMSFQALAKGTTRKVSNSAYFECFIERLGDDQKLFKKQYLFPFPTEKDEVYEIKGSMRWNHYKIVFSQSGRVELHVSELVKGKVLEAVKEHQLGNEPQFKSLKVQLELKDGDVVIPYTVQCGPE